MIAHTYVSVLLPLPLAGAFTYALPEGLVIASGDFVEVPFGSRKRIGVVWQVNVDAPPSGMAKSVEAVLPITPLQPALMGFVEWVAEYTLSPMGSVLKMVLCAKGVLEGKKSRESRVGSRVELEAIQAVQLNAAQQEAGSYLAAQLEKKSYSATLLDGVTGSGKTEVYFSAIEKILREGCGQVLILLPEIVLTSQLTERFKKHFGFAPQLWHSDLTQAKRRDAWRGVQAGEIPVVIGARSALFLPFQKLAMIIVDEEHESAFKQEEGVMYHARDMAVVRAHKENIPILLASATPSLETVQNVSLGKYHRLHLPARHGGASLPSIRVIDMRHEMVEQGEWVAHPLRELLAQNLSRGQQSMLYLNRRGYAPLTLCRNCGHRFQCPDCSSWLVEHRYQKKLQCHHCGHVKAIPEHCPSCGEKNSLVACGPGVERVAEEVAAFLPEARVVVMTSDTMTGSKKATETLDSILKGEVDIIIGTQMIAKGHHFPKLTLVGVVDADLGLSGGDLRAAERTYQLLHQVAGRAGREQDKGRVILQSYMPENIIIEALTTEDRDTFMQYETDSRKLCDMPPFSRLASVIISGQREQLVIQTARKLAQHIPQNDNIRVLGPAPAPLYQLRGSYRYRFLVKTPRTINIQNALRHWFGSVKIPSAVHVRADVDPYTFL